MGLLEAYHRAAVENTIEAAKNFAYWQIRCELIAPSDVIASIQKLVDTTGDLDGRYVAEQEMKAALRRDIGVS